MTRIFLLFAVLAFTMQSCIYMGGKRVRGNGNIETEERSVSAFDEVEVHGSMDVHVSQGDTRPVRLEGDENLLQYIEIKQVGNKLKIGPRPGYNLRPSSKLKVYVTSPILFEAGCVRGMQYPVRQ